MGSDFNAKMAILFASGASWMLRTCIFMILISEISANEHYKYKEMKSNSRTGPFAAVNTISGGINNNNNDRQKRSLFSDSYELELVDFHNELRRQVPNASDMEIMSRNLELTRMAEDWAKLCRWEHGQPHRDNPPFEDIGQNLYAYNGTFDPKRGIQLWFDEYVYYDYDTGGCSKEPCGHYTQMAWSTSRWMGCAYAYCPKMLLVDVINAHYLVCNYGPAGNWVGQKPYKKGPKCSQCASGQFWCNEGLCDDSCSKQSTKCQCESSCLNCGTAIRNNCSCSCTAGWHGPNCAEPCQDKHHYCGVIPGWPPYTCDRPVVIKYCPAMCQQCQVAKSPGSSECPASPNTTTSPNDVTLSTTVDPSQLVTTASQSESNSPKTKMDKEIIDNSTSLLDLSTQSIAPKDFNLTTPSTRDFRSTSEIPAKMSYNVDLVLLIGESLSVSTSLLFLICPHGTSVQYGQLSQRMLCKRPRIL